MNNFSATGRVGRDAIVRSTGSGNKVTGFSLAVDKGFGDRKQTVWFDCSAWGERYEKVAPHITKGALIAVTGEIGTDEYEGKTKITLNVSDITLLGGGKKEERKAVSAGDSDDIPW